VTAAGGDVTVEEICEDFCDMFHLEKDILTCTTAIAHKITTRVDNAPVNVHIDYRRSIRKK